MKRRSRSLQPASSQASQSLEDIDIYDLMPAWMIKLESANEHFETFSRLAYELLEHGFSIHTLKHVTQTLGSFNIYDCWMHIDSIEDLVSRGLSLATARLFLSAMTSIKKKRYSFIYFNISEAKKWLLPNQEGYLQLLRHGLKLHNIQYLAERLELYDIDGRWLAQFTKDEAMAIGFDIKESESLESALKWMQYPRRSYSLRIYNSESYQHDKRQIDKEKLDPQFENIRLLKIQQTNERLFPVQDLITKKNN